MMNIQELIDKRYEIERQIEKLTQLKSDLNTEISTQLLQMDIKEAYGSHGVGYRVMTTTRYSYKPQAYKFIEQKGLLSEFIGKPKITKTGLEKLLKQEKLTYADMAEIDNYTTVEQSDYTLRKVVLEEAKVI